MSYSDQLRQAIKDSGQSLNSIAQAAGMDQSNLSKFVAGKIGISYQNGRTIAEHIGFTFTIEPITPAEPKPCPRCAEYTKSIEELKALKAAKVNMPESLPKSGPFSVDGFRPKRVDPRAAAKLKGKG